MKLLSNKLTLVLIVSVACACGGNKEQTTPPETSSDTVSAASSTVAPSEAAPAECAFAGEYLVGDGNLYIVPVGDTFESQDGTGKAIDVFYLDGKEQDTISVYSNKDKSVIFKMNPDHKTGRYSASGE